MAIALGGTCGKSNRFSQILTARSAIGDIVAVGLPPNARVFTYVEITSEPRLFLASKRIKL